MTGKQRLLAALKGGPVDQPPIWLREGFNIGADPLGEPMADVLGQGGRADYLLGWKREPLYRELFDYVSPHVEVMRSWGVGEAINRFLMIPPEYIRRGEERIDGDTIRINGWLETIVNLGGAEQCTPPLMAPDTFDEYVVPYDGRIAQRLKRYGIPVNMHCHGKVRHALKKMVEMGLDSTDPVELPPAGDVTLAEAREITGGRLTLIGNLEFDELETHSPDHIRRRVKGILEGGTRRLILAASAGPISAVTSRLVENYKAWIDTALELAAGS